MTMQDRHSVNQLQVHVLLLLLHATLPMLILPLMASCIYTGQGDMYYDYAGQAQRQPAAGTCTLAASTCYFTHAHSTSHGIMHIHRTGRYVL